MGFKNLKLSLDTKRIEKPEPATPDYKPWNILSPDYLEDAFPLHVENAVMIFFTHIGATNDEKKDDGCGCGSCHEMQENKNFGDKYDEFYNKKNAKKQETKEKNKKESAPKHHNGKSPDELLKSVQDIAVEKKGKCLTTVWVRNDEYMWFKCKRNHTWEATPKNIKNGSWCPQCDIIDRNVLTIADFQKICNIKRGKCISTVYDGYDVPLEVECHKKHRWSAMPGALRSGEWCRICWEDSIKPEIQEFHEIARGNGGLCLSTVYENAKEKLRFKCGDCGYEWGATPSTIRLSWCPECNTRKKLTIDDMHAWAKMMDGVFLSKEYKGCDVHHKWGCFDGHTWDAKPGLIRNGSWCPYCTINYAEERCRCVFEFLTGLKIPKDRKSIGSELDGYCEELQLAFEHHGKQHYEHVDFFHSDGNTLEQQQLRDAEKRVRCKEENIALIEIPYTKSVDNEPLAQFIYDELISHNIPVVKRVGEIKFEDFKIGKSKLDEIRKIVESKGGCLFSSAYVTSATNVSLGCDKQHTFEMSLDRLKKGDWCTDCLKIEKMLAKIEKMQELASGMHDGHFLSTTYTNNKELYKWMCKPGHTFEMTANDVIGKHWCPTCDILGKKNHSIQNMIELAALKDGEFISTEYAGHDVKHKWLCCEKHEFERTPRAVKQDYWCPICEMLEKVFELQQFAISKGGKFLSTEYIDGKTAKYEWECHGQIFIATAADAKNRWPCYICLEAKRIEKKNAKYAKNPKTKT